MNRTLSDDLSYMRGVAEAGDHAPSLSGRYSLWWAALSVVALVAHWGVITGRIGVIEPQGVGFIWLIFGFVGVLGSFLIGMTLRNKPGLSAPGNRAAAAVWPVTTAAIFIYAIALGFAVGVRGVAPVVFDTILPLAFTVHAINSALGASLFRSGWRYVSTAAALVSVAATAFMIAMPEVYLVAAAGVLAVWLVPGLMDLRSEPKSVEG